MAQPNDPEQPQTPQPVDPNSETLMRRPNPDASSLPPPPPANEAAGVPSAPMTPPDASLPQAPPAPTPAIFAPYPAPSGYGAPYPPHPGYPPSAPYPPQPGYPPQQGYPTSAPYPPQPGYPPQQGYPPSAPYPPQPGYPPQQTYPSSPYQPTIDMPAGSVPPSSPYPAPPGYPPSTPYPPGQGMPPSAPYMPGNPSMPYQPGFPPSSPYMPGNPSMPYQPGMMGQVATMAPPEVSHIAPLARPLPAWTVVIATLAALALIAGLGSTGQDWAGIGQRAGIAAAIVAGLVILFSVIRLAMGLAGSRNPTRGRQLVGLVIVTLLLVAMSGAGIGLQNPLHRAQAQNLESRKLYQQAIDQYTAAGERAPNSTTLAGVYVKWGDALQGQGVANYPDALDKYDTVLKTFVGATTQVKAAQTGEVNLYLAWGQSDLDKIAYQTATNHLNTLLKLTFCDADCQTKGGNLDAKAYYQIAQGQIKSTTCSSALATYITITTRFPNSPDGQQAAKDLKAPQSASGIVPPFTPPQGGYGIAVLVPDGTALGAIIAAINNSPYDSKVSATFAVSFSQVAIGTYNLALILVTSTGTKTFGGRWIDGSSPKVISVGPLCPTQF